MAVSLQCPPCENQKAVVRESQDLGLDLVGSRRPNPLPNQIENYWL
jgi:hypothetical protein